MKERENSSCLTASKWGHELFPILELELKHCLFLGLKTVSLQTGTIGSPGSPACQFTLKFLGFSLHNLYISVFSLWRTQPYRGVQEFRSDVIYLLFKRMTQYCMVRLWWGKGRISYHQRRAKMLCNKPDKRQNGGLYQDDTGGDHEEQCKSIYI